MLGLQREETPAVNLVLKNSKTHNDTSKLQTDGWTDRRTNCYHNTALCLASRGNNTKDNVYGVVIKDKMYADLIVWPQGCNLCKRDLQSLDFVASRLFMKLLKTSDISVVAY